MRGTSGYYYTLQVPGDKKDPQQRPRYYFSNNIFGLMWTILKHRLWHFRNGDGWQD